ncbi:kinase domain protein, partial [Rhizoctonia solani AG-3 Rhs1AP]
MSPELLSVNQQPTTESDMWAAGCVCYWILTGLQPYATHRRDDFAGVESVRGHPPGTLENVDIYHSAWITNGSKEFLGVLQALEGRKLRWLPLNVVDLSGKVRSIGTGETEDGARVAQYTTVWKEYNYVKQRREGDTYVSMTLYETTYAPKWYSKSTPVAIKLAPNKPSNKQPSITLIHKPNWSSRERVQILKDIIEAIAYLHDHPNGSIAHGDIQPANIFVLSNGRAKLTNFSCAFQYIVTHPNSHISFPEQYAESGEDRIFLPTLATDIWSFGSVILSMFSMDFRHRDPASHVTQFATGTISYELEDTSETYRWTKGLIESMLVLDPARRQKARAVMDTLVEL